MNANSRPSNFWRGLVRHQLVAADEVMVGQGRGLCIDQAAPTFCHGEAAPLLRHFRVLQLAACRRTILA